MKPWIVWLSSGLAGGTSDALTSAPWTLPLKWAVWVGVGAVAVDATLGWRLSRWVRSSVLTLRSGRR